MNVSARGLAELAGHEAVVTRRYRDSVGVWTVGVGHTKAAGGIDPITVTSDRPAGEWIALFRKDIAKYEAGVTAALRVPVSQHEFDALVSFHFNTGAIGRATLVKTLNAGDRATAAAQFLSWKSPPEIIGRRTKEMLLFRDGAYSDEPMVTVYPASDAGAVLWSQGRRVPALSLLGSTGSVQPMVPAGRITIRRGDKGPIVAEWQRVIGVTADGDFGPKTETATKAWQSRQALVPDGIVGPKSWAAA